MIADLQPSARHAPEITVIVPVYNAGATLRACLASIFSSKNVSFEVVVVNDASTDNSAAIALEFPCLLINVASNIKAANCRNLGAHFADTELLLFFDADQVMHEDTLQLFVRALREHPAAVAVVGSFEADTPAPGFISKFRNLRHHYVHQMAQREGATLASGLTAIRKAVFEQYHGFEPAFQASSIEDIALGITLHQNGCRIHFRGEIQVTHLKRYSALSMLREDLWNRAVPWTELMLRNHIWRNDLNTSQGSVLSVFCSWLLPVSLIFLLFGLKFALLPLSACLAMIWKANAGLLAVGLHRFGTTFLLEELLFMPLMYFNHGLGFVVGIICYMFGGLTRQNRIPPKPQYEILRGAPAL